MKNKPSYVKFNKNKSYLYWAILFFILWISCTGPLRSVSYPDNPVIKTVIGSAPNFFAGTTFVLWITHVTSSNMIRVFSVSFIVLVLGELIQMSMERQTADWKDVIASFAGCAIGCVIAKGIEKFKPDNK